MPIIQCGNGGLQNCRGPNDLNQSLCLGIAQPECWLMFRLTSSRPMQVIQAVAPFGVPAGV